MKMLILFFSFLSFSLRAERFVVEVDSQFLGLKNLKIENLFLSNDVKLKNYKIITGDITLNELKKIKGIKTLERPIELIKTSLRPGLNDLKPIQDELFSYQWGLKNQGQIYFKESDDIHNLKIISKPGFDIGFDKLSSEMISIPEKIIVAVLDSGVDLNHPELEGRLWKNPLECGKDGEVDHDGNGLKGDCHGWNFTSALDSLEAKSLQDNDGHGTHVAGIIAAKINQKGIVGVSSNSLILPIKVMKDTGSTSEISSSEAFARGITYAVDQGAKIINLSLGWPKTLETKFLRDAVFYALSNGVVLVAAAGNNNSSEPLFPCAYEGVICVGSSTLDGSVARFSNFGGHVDTYAPGEGILSLHPTLFEPDLFSVPGFEIRSGTSQSAPMVSGLIAEVLARQPSLTIDDLFARFYLSKKMNQDSKPILGGVAKFDELIQDVNKPVLRPILKRVRQLVVNKNSSRLKIPIRNFGLRSSEGTLELKSPHKSIQIENAIQKMPSLEKGEGIEFEFIVNILDLDLDHELELQINLQVGDESLNFAHQIPILRDLKSIEEIKTFPISFQNEKIPLGGVRNNELVSFLNTLQDLTQNNHHEVYLKRILKDSEKKDLEITLFKRYDSDFKQANKLILIPFGINLVNFYRIDLNFDGVSDYFLQILCEKEGQKYFSFIYLNQDLNPLWKDYPEFHLNLDLFIENMNEVSFIKLSDPVLKDILVPAFHTMGELPLADQILSSWTKPTKERKNRLYFLERESNRFRLRAATSMMWEKNFSTRLNLDWKETIEIEKLLPSTFADLSSGTVRLLVSFGKGSQRKFQILRFSSKEMEQGGNLSQLVFQTEDIRPLIQLDQNEYQQNGEVYFNIYDRERAKLIFTQDLDQLHEKVVKNFSQDDVIINHIASFTGLKKFSSIIETREELIWLTHGSHQEISSRPKIRYSFLSQKLLSEIYLPLAIKNHDTLRPALYVDMIPITGNRLLLMTEERGKMISPIRHALSVPGNCRPLNPYLNRSEAVHEFVFLCLENQNFSLKILPIQNEGETF